MSKRNTRLGLVALTVTLTAACGSSTKTSPDGTVSSNVMTLEEASNGFGQLVPHTIRKLDAFGNPTPQLVVIRSQQDLIDNHNLSNPILPVPKFPETAVLPNGEAGNQFLYASFSQDIDLTSVLSSSTGAQSNSGLTGAVSVIALDPLTGQSFPVQGRALVNGFTYAGPTNGASPPQLTLQQWVTRDPASGRPVSVVPQGDGFPGTLVNFNGAELLVRPNTFVFIPDADGNLATPETFPTGVQIRLEISTALRSTQDKFLTDRVLACTTVGDDTLGPEVITSPPPLNAPQITPGNGDVNVDPLTALRVEFTEPVQPYSVGIIDGQGPPALSSMLKVQFGPSATRTDMPFTVRPRSVFDLSVFDVMPAFNFPGAGPNFNSCNTFSQVDITVNAGQLFDLAQNPDPVNPGATIPNKNLLSTQTFFVTGQGPGIVNAPVTPGAIVVLRGGAQPGVSTLDLNGFGQSTGDPTFVDGQPTQTDTKFPYNPNVRFHTGLRPPLAVGTCTIDGGSAGVFTLTRDSSLNDKLARAPLISNATDAMIGWALDVAFNNSQFPFGCQAGGGELCTLDGLKQVAPTPTGPNTLGPQQQNQFGVVQAGAPNLVSWEPHPNPPPLAFPPICVSPYLGAKEPTSVDHSPAGTVPKANLLVPGDPFGNPLNNPPIPPSGLLTQEQNTYFLGPSQGQTNLDACVPYQIRQQVGHFLYVLDRQRREITVFNSNRMTIIERITVADPTSLAMGPNLDFLAVTNQSADTVTFIDINPNSSTFHQVVKNTVVGSGPRGIAWQPGNEDVLVCNEIDNSMSIISAFSLEVRREVGAQLNEPFEVCVFDRMTGYAFNRQVYFAYIVNRTGTVAMFESGPNGVNGWGFDDIIGISPVIFENPKTIQCDPVNLQAAAWIAHEAPIINDQPGPSGEGAVSLLFIESGNAGALALGANFTNPQFRSMQLGVQVSVGEEKLSGVPVDLAFDNLRNYGGLTQVTTTFSAGAGIPQNGKGLIRTNGGPVNTNEASFMFVAIPNAVGGSGVIDVLGTGFAGVPLRDTNPYVAGTQPVAASDVRVVADYWRQ